MTINRLRFRRWYLIPGGVVLRRGRLRGERMDRFTPDDTVLSLCSIPAGVAAGLFRNDGVYYSRFVTPLEAEALLAAWRCPFSTPTVEELGDLG